MLAFGRRRLVLLLLASRGNKARYTAGRARCRSREPMPTGGLQKAARSVRKNSGTLFLDFAYVSFSSNLRLVKPDGRLVDGNASRIQKDRERSDRCSRLEYGFQELAIFTLPEKKPQRLLW